MQTFWRGLREIIEGVVATFLWAIILIVFFVLVGILLIVLAVIGELFWT